LVAQSRELQGSITVGGFGPSDPYRKHLFDIDLLPDPAKPFQAPEPPLRYGQLPEIHHIFRDDPKSPPKIITLVFTAGVLATVPLLLGVWGILGANLSHFSQAISTAPVSHGLFYTSIVTLEGIFFMYYTSWKLYQVLPAVAAVGSVAFVAGSRALSEVQQRRLAGLR
jgi:oligosaccharyltransferase complex subunit delta (ribophorin II)